MAKKRRRSGKQKGDKTAKKQRRSGKRFRLLLYERMWKRWAWPCILIVPASITLWWFMPRLFIAVWWYHALALVPAFIAIIILIFTNMARRTTWVQCRANHLRIQTPIYPLAISYARIKEIKPQPFGQIYDPAAEKAARRKWLGPYWSMTSLVVRVSKYPISKRWLRLWFSSYTLIPDTPGFVFLIEDWMGLSRQIEEFRSAWGMERAKKRQEELADRAW